jgi:hypothetical protein
MSDNKLILLDFDDTLICSTELTNYLKLFDEELDKDENYNGNGNNSTTSTQEFMQKILDQFQQCETASISFLNSLINQTQNSFKHEIIIVSNAEMSWITFSLNYFPNLAKFLTEQSIIIKSSRDDYNHITDGIYFLYIFILLLNIYFILFRSFRVEKIMF